MKKAMLQCKFIPRFGLFSKSDCVGNNLQYFTFELISFGLFFQKYLLAFCGVISSGLFCWLQGEPGFHLFGFIMCISATAARAFKSVLQGILLSSEG